MGSFPGVLPTWISIAVRRRGGLEIDRGAEALVDGAFDVADAVDVADWDDRDAARAERLERVGIGGEAFGDHDRVRRDEGLDRPFVFPLGLAAEPDGIRRDLDSARNLVIIGGGYIGLEVASVAIKAGLNVTVLEMEDRILQRVTTPSMSSFYTRVHTEAGVLLRCNAAAAARRLSARASSLLFSPPIGTATSVPSLGAVGTPLRSLFSAPSSTAGSGSGCGLGTGCGSGCDLSSGSGSGCSRRSNGGRGGDGENGDAGEV